MHIFLSANDQSQALSIIDKIDFTNLNQTYIKYYDGDKSFKRYLNVKSKEEAIEQLMNKERPEKIEGDWCFQFTGQGCQRSNMMLAIYNSIPLFKQHLDECFNIYERTFKASLADIIFSDNDDINQTNWTQPALFAVEYAVAKTWIDLGLKPSHVIGHSVGEYPAAVIAGVMSIETGIHMIGSRGQAMQSIKTKGAMAAMMSDLKTTKDLITTSNIIVDIAGINSNKQTVISGDTEAVSKIMILAKERGIRSRELIVSHAFHSNHMEPILSKFKEVADEHIFNTPSKCQIISNVTGDKYDSAPSSEYWAKHIRSPVDFVGGINNLVNKYQINNYIEVGPHPILNTMAVKTVNSECNWLASVNMKDELNCFLNTAGLLFENDIIEIDKL